MAPRLAFLVSGGGGNLRFVWHAINHGILPAEIGGVFADRDCGAANFARERGLPLAVCQDYSSPQWLLDALVWFEPDLIISSLHRVIAPEVVERWHGKIINLHYSLLPGFGGPGMIGSKPIRAALERGCKVIGTTVHFVDEQIDHGAIISQAALEVAPDEPFDWLMDRVFRCGCLNLAGAIAACLGMAAPDTSTLGDDFWEAVKR